MTVVPKHKEKQKAGKIKKRQNLEEMEDSKDNVIKLGVHEAGTYLGQVLIRKALHYRRKSFLITAVCHKTRRNHAAVKWPSSPNLKVVNVDIFDLSEMKNVFNDCDIVVSCIGGRRPLGSLPTRTTLFSEATKVLKATMDNMKMVRQLLMSKNAAAALENSGNQSKSTCEIVEEALAPVTEVDFEEAPEEKINCVFRVIFVSCWGTKSLLDKWDQALEPRTADHFKHCIVKPSKHRTAVEDIDEAESILLSDPEFRESLTIVRAPTIVHTRTVPDASGSCWDSNPGSQPRVHFEENKSYVLCSEEEIRADELSKFLLRCVLNKLFLGKVIAVGIKK